MSTRRAISRLVTQLILAAPLVGSLSCSSSRAREAASMHDARMAWWREARFGLFIHWGLYAIPAGELNGETNHAEWIRTTAEIPIGRYDEFVAQWNPVKFDADAWVEMAKDAGMKYVVITSKHHDGFCLFDSKWTDFDVTSTPFHRDVLEELSEACRRKGLKICWYHSIMDWHHPDYLPRRDWEKATRAATGADFSRYVAHLHRQVGELLTRYGPIGVMWFDGEWEATWNNELGTALYDRCLELQSDVIVNNRVAKGRSGMAGMTIDPSFRGDFGTPEQEIPSKGFPGVDWETCMTMNANWGYNKNDRAWKSATDLVRKLVDIASKGGNFLLNVGPTAEGEFPPESVERLRAIGRWMKVNGDSIHGTSASPFESLPFGRCTMRRAREETRLFLHVFEWPTDGTLVVPGLGNGVRRAFLLAAKEDSLAVTRGETDVRIAVPRAAPDEVCTVIALDVEGSPVVYEMPKIVAPASILVSALDVEITTASPELEARYTLDGSEPTAQSPRYEAPLRLADSAAVRARAFHRGRPVSAVAEATFTKVAPRPAVLGKASGRGLVCESFAGEWDRLPEFDSLARAERWISPNVSMKPGPVEERYALRLTGFIAVPRDDVYRFSLGSDDGSRLWIGNDVVVDNDLLHSFIERTAAVALAAGRHPIRVEWFNKTGEADLILRWARAGEGFERVPNSAFDHP